MKITQGAIEWLNESNKDLKQPVIAVVERVYRG
jgi:hypothetical protein